MIKQTLIKHHSQKYRQDEEAQNDVGIPQELATQEAIIMYTDLKKQERH